MIYTPDCLMGWQYQKNDLIRTSEDGEVWTTGVSGPIILSPHSPQAMAHREIDCSTFVSCK